MRWRDGAAPRVWANALALAALAAVRPASAQSRSAASDCSHPPAVAAATWAPPLDRQVTVYAHDVSLRDALDRLGAAAGIRLSYSTDFLPLDRRVCLPPAPMRVGDALAALLDSVAVDPIVAADDQIVLAPSRSRTSVSPATSSAVDVLERVVVTGSAVGAPERPLTVALDIVSAPQARASDGVLSQMLAAAVPGLWMSGQSPSSLLARYGSIRGATSFGLSYPKMYIDGIEVANPLLITQLDPSIVERVEVIRGPQGAALYGADAISGVVNIITRHDGADPAGGSVQITSTGGAAQSEFAAHAVPQQEQEVSLRTGSNLRSADLSIGGSTTGDFIPSSASSELRGGAAFRVVGSRASLSATARVFAKTAQVAPDPLLTTAEHAFPVEPSGPGRIMADTVRQHMDSVFARPVADSSPESVREYTVGLTGAFLQSDRWTHTLTAGVDGYSLSNLPNDFTPIPSAADSALRAARGSAARGTIRASSVGQFGSPAASVKVTVAAEQTTLREQTAVDQNAPGAPAGGLPGSAPAVEDAVAWTENTGLVTQLDAGFRDALFVTGGLRGERNDGAGMVTTALLPMLGAAWVADAGPFTAKLRSAYGRASRPPGTAARQTTWLGVRTLANDNLQPEQQSGIEIGADLLAGNLFGLHVTRFDQRAFGLIQPVAVVADSSSASGPPVRSIAYTLQNVGEIDNRGWEMESSIQVVHLALNGALSFVDSRVRRVAVGYTGDLRPGDRMLGVPAQTASLSSTWTAASWWATLAFSRAFDWIDYDRVALANVAADPTRRAQDLTGATLRAYWLRYSGVSRLNAAAARDIYRGVALTLNATNLLNVQVGDPDNVTVLPGRAFLAGVRARF